MKSFCLTFLPVLAGLVWSVTGCRQSTNTLFTEKTLQQTGIDFENRVTENDSLNILTYEYLYNGAGVAVGDVNNDGLADIYFSGNMVTNKLYLNRGDFKFEDITGKAGVAGRERWKTGVSMADINADGWLDIYVCYSGPGADEARRNELYINNGIKEGVPVFTESAAQYGLDAPGTYTTQCAFFDMDRDGDLDAFMVNHAAHFYNAFFNTSKLRRTRHPQYGNRLYKNENGKYRDVSEEAGIDGSGLNFGLSVSVSDLNNDNWPDLYVSNDYNEQDFLYLNNHNGTFTEVLKKSMGHISQFSMGSDIADYNNDLLPDVVTLDMLPGDNKRQKLLKGPDGYDLYQLLVDSGFHHQNMRNMLQLNMGTGKDSIPQFSEVGQLAGISNTDWSWTPLLADFDNDGWKDIYITNGYLRDYTNLDFLKFTYAEADREAKQAGKKINTWQLVQQMPSTRVSDYLFHNDHHLRFTNKAKEWGLDKPTVSTGAAYADLDNDGDLDLVVNNTNDPAMLFQNNTHQSGKHYIRIQLQGNGNNTYGIGSKITVETDSTKQFKELYMARGFQSSVEPVAHFGLGNESHIKTIHVQWPDGNISQIDNIKADTLLVIKQSTARPASLTNTSTTALFTDYTLLSGIDYTHEAGNSIDFKKQFLLPHQVSKQGPCLASADVNGDGLEDVFIGGTVSAPGKLFLQSISGQFIPASSQPWATEQSANDAGVLFFDADGDKDTDLYIVKTGADFPANDERYQDQLYINNGKGQFSKTTNTLPNLTTSGSCVAAADYDKDGDNDLFIGGRFVPGSYPVLPTSYLLRNESKNGIIKFEYASDQTEKLLRQPGMVTTAVWADINKDSWPDLMVAGEFMPVTIFENQQGQLVNQTNKYGLSETSGAWCKLLAEDMDSDGDMDLVAGNMGWNTQFKASVAEPVGICYNDFDKNGSIDPLFCYYIQGKNYPYASLDELAEQVPVMRKKFLRYETYSNASFDQLFTPEQQEKAVTIKATQLASCYFENKEGKFICHPLPIEAQFSAIMGIISGDWNNDGKKDLLISGNYYPWRVQLGRMDASCGWWLQGDGHGDFKAIYPQQNGFVVPGDVRDMIMIAGKQYSLFIAARNDEKVLVIKTPSNGFKN